LIRKNVKQVLEIVLEEIKNMSKIVPFRSLFNLKKYPELSEISVVVNDKKQPAGFLFGRDAFIEFLEKLDETFEKNIDDPKRAYTNPAGRLIDAIEAHLTVDPKFTKKLKTSIKNNITGLVSLSEIERFLHV
jgi:hypothetical protein